MKNFKTAIGSLPSSTRIRVTGIGYKSGFDVTCQVRDVAIYNDGRVSILNPVGSSAKVLHTYLPEIRSCEVIGIDLETALGSVRRNGRPVFNEQVDDYGYPVKCRD